MRVLVVVAVVSACTKAAPPSTAAAVDEAPTAVDLAPGAAPMLPPPVTSPPDAGITTPPATEIKPLALDGPYPTLRASCQAARPCGFTRMDPAGDPIQPATKPDCAAVLDPTLGHVSMVPDSIRPGGGYAKLTHELPAAEIRIGEVGCAVPKGLREEHSEHYVFVRRPDGWWRTSAPLFTYDYNEKYCGGGLYVTWHDKPTRTIAGIAAMYGCMTCSKQGTEEHVTELMLRIEVAGSRPLVFSPLPVGQRTNRTVDADVPSDASSDPACKPIATRMSMKEHWVSDDEVTLEGTGTGAPIETPLEVDGRTEPAAAGTYRFTR